MTVVKKIRIEKYFCCSSAAFFRLHRPLQLDSQSLLMKMTVWSPPLHDLCI